MPTGNFGNILAGWMAKKMGLPISKLICGSNQNDILTRFFENGIMKRKNVFLLIAQVWIFKFLAILRDYYTK